MREDWPSSTAAAVALARGVMSLPKSNAPASDPIAASLLRKPWQIALAGLAPIANLAPVVLSIRVGTLGFVDHIALRTAAIDEAVKRGVEGGSQQLVILGAGLDARAFRMPELASTCVFEVDHPATQRFKRRRVERLAPTARDLRFVEVDFERESFADKLEAQGHDPNALTTWIWEGVTMYLERDATLATLRASAGRSAPGSLLAVTYAIGDRWSGWRAPVKLAFRALGEPLSGMTTRRAFHDLLTTSGWTERSDEGTADWSRRFDFGLPGMMTVDERLAIAVR